MEAVASSRWTSLVNVVVTVSSFLESLWIIDVQSTVDKTHICLRWNGCWGQPILAKHMSLVGFAKQNECESKSNGTLVKPKIVSKWMFIPIQPPFVYRNDRFWPIQKYWWTEYVESCSIPSHRGTPAETCGRGEDKDVKRLNAVDEHQRESGVSVNSFHSLLWNVYGVDVVFSGRYPFPIFLLPTKYCLILPQPDETYDDGVLWWMCIGNWLCEMMWYAMAKMCLITCVYIYRERERCVYVVVCD